MNTQLLKNLIETIKKTILALQQLLRIRQGVKGFDEFASALRMRESSNNYKIVNAYGFLGAYQFGMARLCDLGYTERKTGTSGYSNTSFIWKAGYSQDFFLNNPNFQDRVFKEHADNLIARLKITFMDRIGKSYNGIEITLSGLLAGAHIGGVGGVSNFFKGQDASDQLGTKVSDYIKGFSGYNIG